MKISRSDIIDALYDAGLDADSLREDYSGRAMYGESCFGIVCSDGEALHFVASIAIILEGRADDWHWVEDVRTDSMGLSTIWYWPGIKLGEN